MSFEDLDEGIEALFEEASERGSGVYRVADRLGGLHPSELFTGVLRTDSWLSREAYCKNAEREARRLAQPKHKPRIEPPMYEQRECSSCGGILEVRPGVPNMIHLGPAKTGCSTKPPLIEKLMRLVRAA